MFTRANVTRANVTRACVARAILYLCICTQAQLWVNAPCVRQSMI